MRLLAVIALTLLTVSAISQTTTPAYVPPPGPQCLPALDLHNVRSVISGNLVENIIWCPQAGNQIGWWSFGGTLDEALSPACIAALFGQGGPAKVMGQQDLANNAWSMCMDRDANTTNAALAQGLADVWVPRVVLAVSPSPVYVIDKNGRIYPLILNNVAQTVTMPNQKGAHCAGTGYNDSKSHYWYSMVGLTTDQGTALVAPAQATTNRLDYAAQCVVLYPPATGWTT
jgi:hypothetical protein